MSRPRSVQAEAAGPDREDRARLGAALLPGQIGYQLRLIARNPLGAFVTLVIPIMLLVALDLVTPEMTLASLGKLPVVQFLTPAMAAFAVLNAGFVDTVIGMSAARESGVLKQLRVTPLPRWTYLAGRLGSTLIVAACAVTAVLAVGVVFFHAHVAAHDLAPFAGSAAAGLVTTFALGLATATLVSSSETALPISYGLLLPMAFISGVFFPAPSEAHWLHVLAEALPAQPIANSMEAAFSRSPHAITTAELLTLGLWTLAGMVVAGVRYSWQPSKERPERGRHHPRSIHRSVLPERPLPKPGGTASQSTAHDQGPSSD